MTILQKAADNKATDRAYPSRLVLLHELRSLAPGTKVRFLACIETFEVGSDVATFSCKSDKSRVLPMTSVNLEAILGTLPPALLDVGSWLNIVGYIADPPDHIALSLEHKTKRSKSSRTIPYVQAIIAWGAGQIDLTDYEDTVRALRGDNDKARQ